MRKNWKEKKLKEIGIVQTGSTPKTADKRNYGDFIPFIKPADIDISGNGEIRYNNDGLSAQGLKKGRKIKAESILMVCIGATIGKVGYIDRDVSCNQQINTLTVKKEFCPKFVYHALTTSVFFDKVIRNSAQATLPIINKSKWENLTLWFPESLTEQQRIVAILDEAFAAIAKAKANTEKNLQNANELFESYLQSVFKSGETWNREKLGSLIEKGWIISHLDGNHGGDYPKKEEFVASGVPYISANCLKGTFADLSLAKYLSLKRALTIKKGVALNNDVLFAHNATVGPVAILRTTEEKVILGTSLTYYRCNPEYILPEYLANYMRSKEFKSQYESVMRQSTRNQVPITKQREFYHIVPPIEIQRSLIVKIEFILENSQKLQTIYQQKLNMLKELKKSILQKAFSGELKTLEEIAV